MPNRKKRKKREKKKRKKATPYNVELLKFQRIGDAYKTSKREQLKGTLRTLVNIQKWPYGNFSVETWDSWSAMIPYGLAYELYGQIDSEQLLPDYSRSSSDDRPYVMRCLANSGPFESWIVRTIESAIQPYNANELHPDSLALMINLLTVLTAFAITNIGQVVE